VFVAAPGKRPRHQAHWTLVQSGVGRGMKSHSSFRAGGLPLWTLLAE
jgi:hypothetical protein